MKFSELDTQPKIPPCASIISSICRFVLQLAPQEAKRRLKFLSPRGRVCLTITPKPILTRRSDGTSSSIHEAKIYLSSGTRPAQNKNCSTPAQAIMRPIDLTIQPPRSPYQKMEGLYMMPRTIDKLRAKLPGGKIGAYSITTAFGPGLSLLLLDDIGVTEKSLLEIVQKVSVEHEIADWLRRNADLSSPRSKASVHG
jgi:hypothetical protein